MKHYLGHKIVKGVKIVDIKVGRDALSIVDEFGVTHTYNKPDLYTRLRTAVPGDYLVVYQDGYTSLSPFEPFVNGYTPLPITEQHLGVMKEPIKYRVVTDVKLEVEADTFDHYMVSFDTGYRVEATTNNCKDPKAVQLGDVFVTYPTGRVEFLSRSDFDLYFNEAPMQILPKLPEPEVFIVTDEHANGRSSNVDMIKLDSKIDVLAAYDTGGDELDFDEFELSKGSKDNPDPIIVVGRNTNRLSGHIVGYIYQKEQRIDFSSGVGALKLSITRKV